MGDFNHQPEWNEANIDFEGAFDHIPEPPMDPMFGLSAAYKADTSPQKVDLGVGAYRDGHAQPWVLPSVVKAKHLLFYDTSLNHEYLPITGLDSFVLASQRLLLGRDSHVLRQGLVASVQTLSGTGALQLGASFLQRWMKLSAAKKVYLSQPPYVNHVPIFEGAGLRTAKYPYYSHSSKTLDIEAMLKTLHSIPTGSVVLLHACAHNPTGTDPSPTEWEKIADLMQRQRQIPFFDIAYQGFTTGDVDRDAWPVRLFVERGFDSVLIAQSYAKNFGLYGERVGCLHVVLRTEALAGKVRGQLSRLQRVNVSTPPAYGARIVSLILNNEQLYEDWLHDIRTMAERIARMRYLLRANLETCGAAGDWKHITNQVGMFCDSGLEAKEVELLKDVYHVYMTPGGRVNIAGLTDGNVEYVAKTIAAVRERARL